MILFMTVALYHHTDRRPIMPELTDFPGKTRHFNIATEIGMQYYMVGITLLNDQRGTIIPAIVSEHRGNAEQINMDILSRWVQGRGIADRAWRGLLGVLRVHCPSLAQDIEETLRTETGTSAVEVQLAVEPESEAPTSTSSNSLKSTVNGFLTQLHNLIIQQLPFLTSKSEPVDVQPSDPIKMPATALPSRPSLEECFNSVGLPVDCVLLDKQVSDATHIADIAKKLTQWRDLFTYFGLEEYEKEEIEAAGDLSEQKRKLLTMWTQKYGPKATYRHLCTILYKQYRLDLVEAVCEVMKSTVVSAEAEIPSHTPPQQQSALSLLNKKLRDWYAANPLPYYFNPRCYKWMANVSEKFIHPDIINKEEQEEYHKEAVLRGQRWRITTKGSGDTVQLDELLRTRSGKKLKCKVILVEGGPGMGKSTLAWQVCHRWGRRELFFQYSTVLLLPLRDKRVQQANQLEDLFFHLRDKKAQEEIKWSISNGRDTLVILDGLDELPGHLLSEQSIFADLLSGEVLGDATILVTSRPSATRQLQIFWKKQISKHFVLHGFNEGDIEEYIKSILSSEQLTEFKKHLSIHPHIQSIMYVPLHSAIVMAVYLQHKQLPKTRTQLYMALIETILSQYIDDHLECYGEMEVSSTIGLKLPTPVNTHFMELCKIAFDTVCGQELIFTDQTMPKVLNDLGFTDSVPGLYMHRTCSYNFLHLSIQEFLAAYHVSLLSPQEQEQLLLKSRTEHHFENMMRFVAGLTKFDEIKREAVEQVVVVKEENTEWSEESYSLDKYSLELLYESQNLGFLNKDDTYSANINSFSLEHYWLALGYCIANSKCAWKLVLHNVNIQMLLQGLRDCKTQPAYTIKSITWVLYSDEEHCKLMDFTAHTEGMVLGLGICGRGVQHNLTRFCQWLELPICHLKTLSLPYLQPCNIEMASRALNAVPSLKTLIMKESTFTLQSMQAFASMLQQNQSLTKVNISCCSIRSDTVSFLAKALHSNTTLTELDIGCNTIGMSGGVEMAKVLEHNTALTVLNMRMNSLLFAGPQMAIRLKHNTTLMKLDISMNAMWVTGARKMAELLKHNTTLTVLNMSENEVGNGGAQAMAEMLEHNTTLEELGMYDCTIGVEGAKALVQSLAVNHHLKKLLMYIPQSMRALPSYHANKERIM